MTNWRHRLHRGRIALQALFAFAVILFASLIGLCRLLLPWIVNHPEQIDQFLSGRLGRSVHVERAEGRWENGGPLLNLYNVSIATNSDETPWVISQAEFSLDFFSWLEPTRTWSEFRLLGLELTLERGGSDLPWELRGLKASSKDSNTGSKTALFQLGTITLKDAQLHVDDIATERHLVLGISELRLVNDGNHHRLTGTVNPEHSSSPPISIVADYNDSDASAQLYVGGENLAIDYFMEGIQLGGISLLNGQGKVDLWTIWHSGKLLEARVEVDLENFLLEANRSIELIKQEKIVPRINIDHLSGGWRWRYAEDGWTLDIADFVLRRADVTTAASAMHIAKHENKSNEGIFPEYTVLASTLDIGSLASVGMLADAISPTLRQWLNTSYPQGKIEDLNLRYIDSNNFDISAHLTALGCQPAMNKPGMQGFNANLLGDQEAFTLTLPSHQAVALDLLRVFRKRLEFSEFSGQLALYRMDDAWRLETPSLSFEGVGYSGELRGLVDIQDDGSHPLLDVATFVQASDIQAADLFWPKSMPNRVISWLDQALVAGKLQTGRLVLRGDLDDWPFRKPTGRFEARADIDDLTLNYHPKWPRGEHLHVAATFINDSLEAIVKSGEVSGNTIDKATGVIRSLSDAQLDLEAEGGGRGKTLLGLIKKSPLGQRYSKELVGVEIGGRGQAKVRLHLPFKQEEPMELEGNVVLTDADLQAAQWNLKFAKADGTVRFNQSGLAADDLSVMLEDQPMNLSLLMGGFAKNHSHRLEAELRGNLPVKRLFADFPALDRYSSHFYGAANWNIGLDVTAVDSSTEEATKTLKIESDLQGVTMDFPAPLSKSANQKLPLNLSFTLPLPDARLDLALGDLLRLRSRLPGPQQPFAADIVFGKTMPTVSSQGGVRIHGELPQLDASGWLTLLNNKNLNDKEDFLHSLDIQATKLQFYSQNFPNTALSIQSEKGEKIVKLKGEKVEGIMRLPMTDITQRGITAQFQRLYLLGDEQDLPTSNDTSQPTAIPPLHISIEDFRVAQAHYGSARLETNSTATGMHVEKFETRSPNLDINARGDWEAQEDKNYSRFKIDFTSENLGHMLDALGYAGVVEDGQTIAHLEGQWEGSPASFAMAKLDGSLNIDVAKGRILDVNPGAGRLLGLLSLTEIPRRLSLDFSDLFTSGMTFDSINGLFTLQDGNAYTNNLQLKGPAASIAIRGRTGLKTKDYDQEMEVTPHVGGTLPIVGALTGGPVGAAAGFVLQGIFHQPLNTVARARYRVSGSWEKPDIKLVEKETTKSRRKQTSDSGD